MVSSPPHIPKISSTKLPLGVPAQSAQELLSPLQTLHSSVSLVTQSGSKSLQFETYPLGWSHDKTDSLASPRPSPSPS